MTIRRVKNRKSKWRYYFVFMVDGRYYRGGGYDSKTDALFAEGKARTFLISPEKTLFNDAAKEYFKHCREDLQQSEGWVRDKENVIGKHFRWAWSMWPVSKITPAMIEKTVRTRKSNRDIKVLKGIFNFALKKGWVTKNPCVGISFRATHRARYVPPLVDFKKVLTSAKPYDQKLLTMLFCTAGRISEILSLRWDDVGDKYLLLRSRKHRYGEERERKIPLSPMLKESIEWLRGRKRDGWLFSNPKMSGRYLRRPKLMRSMCEKADVKPFGFHSVRHLAASMLSKDNVPIKDVSEFLGHSSISTTQIYLHSLEEGLQDLSEKLSDGIA